jgi:hypothetical protein
MAPETHRRNKRNSDIRKALAIVIAIPVVASGSVLLVFFLSSREEETGLSTRCADSRQVADLDGSDVGQIVVAKGRVAGSRETDAGLLLDLGGDYPDQDLSILIRQGSIETWTAPPGEQYAGENIAFAGELKQSDGSLQVEARFPGDLAVCP